MVLPPSPPFGRRREAGAPTLCTGRSRPSWDSRARATAHTRMSCPNSFVSQVGHTSSLLVRTLGAFPARTLACSAFVALLALSVVIAHWGNAEGPTRTLGRTRPTRTSPDSTPSPRAARRAAARSGSRAARGRLHTRSAERSGARSLGDFPSATSGGMRSNVQAKPDDGQERPLGYERRARPPAAGNALSPGKIRREAALDSNRHLTQGRPVALPPSRAFFSSDSF